jgi:hypothetical protein
MHRRRPLGDVGEHLLGGHRRSSRHEGTIGTMGTRRRSEKPPAAVGEVFE